MAKTEDKKRRMSEAEIRAVFEKLGLPSGPQAASIPPLRQSPTQPLLFFRIAGDSKPLK